MKFNFSDLKEKVTQSSRQFFSKLKMPFGLSPFSKHKEQKKLLFVPNERQCSKCGETKKLNTDNFQKVKAFRTGFSYYCNSCNK